MNNQNPNGWPGKPGVPLNPERNGWHWMGTPDGELAPYEWRAADECERGRWPSYWVSQGEDCWDATECKYLGPCLTPDEVEARIAEVKVKQETDRMWHDVWDTMQGRNGW